MFEKEAEEYQKEVIAKKDYPHCISVDWQRGAEFGFQKGIKAKINFTTISDCPIKDDKLTEAKEIIKSLLPLTPSGYNDMGNCDYIWEVKQAAEAFLETFLEEDEEDDE